MQDNKDLVDKGWEQMRNLLDKEMPEKTKVLWMWWLIPMALILGGVSTYMYKAGMEKSIPSVSSFAEKTSPLSDHVMASYEGPEIDHTLTILKPNNNSEINNHVKTTSKISSAQQDNVDHSSSSKSQNNNTQASKSNVPSANLSGATPILNEVQKKDKTLKGTALKLNNYEAQQAEIPIYELKTPILIQNIQRLQSNLVLKETGELSPSLLHMELKNTHNRRLRLSVYAGLNNSIYSIPGGFEVGSMLNFDVSKKWSIATGLSYSDNYRNGYEPNFNLRKLNREEAFFDDPALLNYYDLDKTYASYEETAPLVQNLQYLNLPIEIAYNLFPRWSLGLGVKFSHLLNANNLQGQNLEVGSALNESAEVNNILYEKSFYRSTDYALLASVKYHIKRRWSVGLQWNHGFNPVISIDQAQGSTQRADLNRDLNAAFYYSF